MNWTFHHLFSPECDLATPAQRWQLLLPIKFQLQRKHRTLDCGGALLELFVWNVRKWTNDNGYVNWWLGLDKQFLDFGCFCGLGVLRRCPSEHVKTTPHTEPSYEYRCTVWFTAAIDLQRAAGSGSTLGPPCPSLGPLLGRSGTAALPSL